MFVVSSGHFVAVGDEVPLGPRPKLRLSNAAESIPADVQRPANSVAPLYLGSVRPDAKGAMRNAPGVGPMSDLDVAIERARPFEISQSLKDVTSASVGESIELDLFTEKNYPAALQHVSTNAHGTKSLVLKLADFDFAYAFIAITGDEYSVSIDVPERGEQFETRAHPTSAERFLVQLDQTRLDFVPLCVQHDLVGNKLDSDGDSKNRGDDTEVEPADEEQPIRQLNDPKVVESESSDNPIAGGELNYDIDVMIVYTLAARNMADSSYGGIHNVVANAISRANTVSNNTNLGMTFNLVYHGVVNYTMSGSSQTDLARLAGTNDGYMDEVHAIRNEVGADIVHLLTTTNDTGGLGNLLNNRYGDASRAFALTRVQQAGNSYTVIHEMGHNMGCHHSKYQNFQPGPTFWTNWSANNWSAGWRFQSSNTVYYTTVMAYDSGSYYSDGNHSIGVGYFSDPNLTYQGQPLGHVTGGDNARTLRTVAPYIAAYRVPSPNPSENKIHGGYAFYFHWISSESWVDTSKTVAREDATPFTLGFSNLVNTAYGIAGIGFEFDFLPWGVTDLTEEDFIFQVSPLGAFDEASNPPDSWELAPAPVWISVSGGTSPRLVDINWHDGVIANRWLRVTVLANENTALPEPQVFYLGHLQGETNAPENGYFSVNFSDLATLRSFVGQNAEITNIADIDKDGVVTFSDLGLARSNLGAELPAITIPADSH